MKRLIALMLALCLAGCSAPVSGPAPATSGAGTEYKAGEYRIADGTEDGSLLLAGQGEHGSLDRVSAENLTITLDGEAAVLSDLEDGMLATLYCVGEMQYTYPGGFYHPTRLEAVSKGADDRVGLVLQALEDLWSEDTALNENIEQLSVHIDEALVPNAAERDAAAWRFAELHQLPPPMTYSWKELCEEGYVNEEELSWEKGCYFELKAAEDAGTDKVLRFNAQKWRGGLAAIMYDGCTAKQKADGSWSYERSVFAIA